MREIVTIQAGDFANFVGSHFWNFQDELLGLADDSNADSLFKNSGVDMNILYRSGETHQGAFTYCPRLISIGSQGSLGTLNSSMYGHVSSVGRTDISTWNGNVERSVSEPLQQNLFLQSLFEQENGHSSKFSNEDCVESLENGVKFWTDYSKVQYHPRSLYELKGSWMDFSNFDSFGTGRELVSRDSHMEELKERLRFFMEECDHIQGIQFLVDDSGAFSGVAAEYLEHVADEYANTPVLLYSMRDTLSHRHHRNMRELIGLALHDATSFSKLSLSCHLMIPTGLPSLSRSPLSSLLCIDDEKIFHSSAVYAASIHSICMAFRLELGGSASYSTQAFGAIDVGQLVNMLSGQARQNTVSVLDVAIPAPALTESTVGSVRMNLQPLTPEIEGDGPEDPHAAEAMVVHGVFDSGGNRASIAEVTNSIHGRLARLGSFHLTAALCPLPIPLPFPSIFGGSIGRYGEILDNVMEDNRSKGSLDVDSVPMAVRLRSSTAVIPLIEARLSSLHKYGLTRGSRGAVLLRDWGFDREEVEDMSEHLSKMLQVFCSHSETSSDSD